MKSVCMNASRSVGLTVADKSLSLHRLSLLTRFGDYHLKKVLVLNGTANSHVLEMHPEVVMVSDKEGFINDHVLDLLILDA